MFISKINFYYPSDLSDQYPFSLPLVNKNIEISFRKPITFLIGENGTGKSTLIESIAVAAGLNAEGGSKNNRFSTRESHSLLYKYIKLHPDVKITNGYFLRVESFYTYANWLDDDHEEHLRERMWGPSVRQAAFGKSLHTNSHGESFWSIIENQFIGNGLYILDEPESALSVTRLIALIYKMNEMVCRNSQFIISTHSPILLAAKDSSIIEIQDGMLNYPEFDECKLVNIYKSVLKNPRILDQG